MIRGWRNDPGWVEFYKARDEERLKREFERVKMRMDCEQMQRSLVALAKLDRSVPWGLRK